MSHHDHHQDVHQDPDPADSRADTIAAFFAIAIAVCGVLFFISQHFFPVGDFACSFLLLAGGLTQHQVYNYDKGNHEEYCEHYGSDNKWHKPATVKIPLTVLFTLHPEACLQNT